MRLPRFLTCHYSKVKKSSYIYIYIYNILKHKIKFVVSQITQTKEFERFLEIKNKTKYVYTINNLSLIDNYYSYIDGIVTDYPDIMSLK